MQKPKGSRYCFNCMKPIGRGKPVQVYVSADFCHSSYWNNEDKKIYGKLTEDGEHGWLYLHKACSADPDSYATSFGEGYENCDSCGVTFNSDDLNMPNYEITGDINCPDCCSIEGSVLKPSAFPISTDEKIGTHVFSDYDNLDAIASKAGYTTIEPRADEKINSSGLTGLGNDNLHCGWIATMGDSSTSVEDMIELLNQKVALIGERNPDFVVGFAQTGHFSVGYSIYEKQKAETLETIAAKVERNIQMLRGSTTSNTQAAAK